MRVGQSTGTTGTPTISIWTRRDLWIEYESSARVWWRYGHRPGMIVTHAHPAYLYGGGPMLSGSYEYFGMLNIWVPPPDTDELAEQGLRFWTRVKPDIPFMGFSTGRFFEVAAKLGIDPKDAGLEFKGMPGFGMGKGMPLMTAGAECYAYVGGACGQMPGAHINEDWGIVQAVDPATGAEVADGEWGDLVVTTLDRDNGLLRYDLEEACAILREPCPCGETSIRGLWGGRFKDLIAVQGTRFQANEVESALRGVAAVNEPTLEWQMVRPADETAAPLVVRVERGTGAGGRRRRDRRPVRGGASRERARHRRRRRGARPRDHPPFGLQGGAGWSTSDDGTERTVTAARDVRRAAPGDAGRRAAGPRRQPAALARRGLRGRTGSTSPPSTAGSTGWPTPSRRRGGRGDRLLWLGQNCHRLLEGLLAAAKLGAVFCPANWRQSADEFAFVIDDCRSRRWCSGRRPRSATRCARPATTRRVRRRCGSSTTGEGEGSYEAFLAGGADHRSGAADATRRRPCS